MSEDEADDQAGAPAAARGSRFVAGHSGNPRGRPRKRASGPSAFDVIVDRMLTVTDGGRARALGVDEALEMKTYQAAIGGNAAARRQILAMIATREGARGAMLPAAAPVTIKISHLGARNADAALCLLEIAGPDPAWRDDARRLTLAPWAVQAALGRKGAQRLTAAALAEIRAKTRDAAALCWPTPVDEDSNHG